MDRTELLARADAWIAAHREEYILELQQIARIPSVSRADLAAPGAPFGPDCRRVLDYALERGRFYGFSTADHDGYAGSITWGDAAHSIGVIAHLDVVPVGDGWVYPPFGATYLPEHDVLIGRGVDDNKSAFVAGLFTGRGGYAVTTNKERGLGRPDIDLRDKKNRRAMIIEAKKAESEERMEYWCNEALRQIKDGQYAENMTGYKQVLCYGIAFYQKSALVKKRK